MNSVKKTPQEEDEIDLARLQLQLREMEVKSTFEQTESEKRRLSSNLSTVKQENRTLQSVLDSNKMGALTDSAAYQRKQTVVLNQKLHNSRKQYDALKYDNDLKEDTIFKTTDKLMDLDAEAGPFLKDNSPVTQKIRMLENRLDKSLIKHNEAMAIRRTYETIVKRLRAERVGFDNQLSAIERTLKAKGHDYQELKNMEHDASHAKELKKAEVQSFKVAYAEARREKKKELEKRKKYVTDRMEAAKKHEIEMKERQRREEEEQDKRLEQQEVSVKVPATQNIVELRTQEEEERFRQYAEQYRRIQEVTRAKTVEEVTAKFLAQEEMHMQLMVMKADVEAKTESRREEINQLRSKNEVVKYSGTGQLTSRRIVDEFETHYAEAQIQLEKASKNYEILSRTFSAAKAGVEHLAEKLSSYRPDVNVTPSQPNQPPTLDEVLQLCETKLLLLGEEQEELKRSPERKVPPPAVMDAILNTTMMDMPANNVRVSLQADYDDDENDMSGGYSATTGGTAAPDEVDEDLQGREGLKEMSRTAVERENKKRRRRNKRDEE